MRRRDFFQSLCAVTLVAPWVLTKAAQDDEEFTIKLEKKLDFTNFEEARKSLTNQLLTPTVKLGAKREIVQRQLGKPKEVYGFGSELYALKTGMVTISYTTDSKGDTIVNLVEFRPKKENPWANWLKTNVQLPAPPPDTKKKTPVQITTKIKIDQADENQGLQITLIGNQKYVAFINWSIIF